MSLTSAEETQAMQRFRAQLLAENIIQESGDSLGTQKDHVLVRFLRARKFNPQQSKIMLQNCMEWRNTVAGCGIDKLYRRLDPLDYPERNTVYECWPMWFHKTDKIGRPIGIQMLGTIDMEKLHGTISPERHWETICTMCEAYYRELFPACSRITGRLVDKCLVIVDLKSFGFNKFWQIRTQTYDCFQMIQEYFPEILGQLLIINAPYGFPAIWRVVRTWLSKETVDKVVILGADYQDTLLKLIDAENLPQMFGGKCTCENDDGCLWSHAGPWMEGRKKRREGWLKGDCSLTSPSPWDETSLGGTTV